MLDVQGPQKLVIKPMHDTNDRDVLGHQIDGVARGAIDRDDAEHPAKKRAAVAAAAERVDPTRPQTRVRYQPRCTRPARRDSATQLLHFPHQSRGK